MPRLVILYTDSKKKKLKNGETLASLRLSVISSDHQHKSSLEFAVVLLYHLGIRLFLSY